MKRLFVYLILLFSFFALNAAPAYAGFSSYNDQIKTQGRTASDKSACNKLCPIDGTSYYQLTTGLPIFGPNAVKCACIPVSLGIGFFLEGVITFILGSIGTVTTILIIISGFQWAFSAGNPKIISESRGRIMNAIIGLALTLTCGLALQVINPNLLSVGGIDVKPVNIAATGVASSCGSITAKMNRSKQLCSLNMGYNPFLNSDKSYTLKWRVCDIDGKNCGEQVVTQDKKTWPMPVGGNSLNPVCTSSNIDKFGRFTIIIDEIKGISDGITFNCGVDESGPSFVYTKNSVGSYCYCRSKGGACVSADSNYCGLNTSEGNCKADDVGIANCFSNSILSATSASAVYASPNTAAVSTKPFTFYCEASGSNYSVSDYNICNFDGSCVDYNTQIKYGSVNPFNNANMGFAIKILNSKDKNFDLKCKVPYDNEFKSITIPSNIIKDSGNGAMYYFCIGGNNECGVKNYDQIRFTTKNYYYSSSDISCDNLSGHHKSKTACQSIMFGNYSKCFWNGSTCMDFSCANLGSSNCTTVNPGLCKIVTNSVRGGGTMSSCIEVSN